MNTWIVSERDGAVGTIVLNRPDRRNALSLALIEELTATIDEVGRDASIRVVVLGARGPAFCAGHDLVEMRGKDEAFFQRLYGTCGDDAQNPPAEPTGDRPRPGHGHCGWLPSGRRV